MRRARIIVAVGPVFATGTEAGCGAGDCDWRSATGSGAGDESLIVAIGGITRRNAQSVIEAGQIRLL